MEDNSRGQLESGCSPRADLAADLAQLRFASRELESPQEPSDDERSSIGAETDYITNSSEPAGAARSSMPWPLPAREPSARSDGGSAPAEQDVGARQAQQQADELEVEDQAPEPPGPAEAAAAPPVSTAVQLTAIDARLARFQRMLLDLQQQQKDAPPPAPPPSRHPPLPAPAADGPARSAAAAASALPGAGAGRARRRAPAFDGAAMMDTAHGLLAMDLGQASSALDSMDRATAALARHMIRQASPGASPSPARRGSPARRSSAPAGGPAPWALPMLPRPRRGPRPRPGPRCCCCWPAGTASQAAAAAQRSTC
jgi:hypothetical protein